MAKKFRIESDTLGTKKVLSDKLWGAQTQRSLENFKIGKEKMPIEVIIAIGYQKKAATMTNMQLGKMDKKLGSAIIKACDEIINLKLIEHFPLSIWQTGSGTQTNMNTNEVIANRAIQILKGKLGSKNPIHPNDHVNMSQSSNDVFPTVMHISSILAINKNLIPAVDLLHQELLKKERQFKKIIKIGRTHTQDATPLSLGQEFSGYKEQIHNNKKRLLLAMEEIYFLAQGGTAIGTGINAPKNFDTKFCNNLSKIIKLKFKPSKNKFEAIAAHDAILNLSSVLNTLAVSLFKISNDLRFLSSGPRAGLSEITLPINEPGSSIMPGKTNPTQIEALSMVCAQVIGNNVTVNFSGTQGNFELNTFKPVIAYNIIQSVKLLSDSIKSFNKNCLTGIKPNHKNIKKHLQNSLMLVTALNKHIGYENAAKIAKQAFKENISLKEAALKLQLIDGKTFDKIVNVKKMV